MWCPNPECVDAVENGAPGEFREGITHCPMCGSALVPSIPSWAGAPAASVELVPCLTVTDNSLLPQIKALLDSVGVRYLVKDEGVQHLIGWGTAALGFNPITGPPVLMVLASEFKRASELLRDFKEAVRDEPGPAPSPLAPASQTPSRCDRCGKALEVSEGDESLPHCYHCGWPLGSA